MAANAILIGDHEPVEFRISEQSLCAIGTL